MDAAAQRSHCSECLCAMWDASRRPLPSMICLISIGQGACCVFTALLSPRAATSLSWADRCVEADARGFMARPPHDLVLPLGFSAGPLRGPHAISQSWRKSTLFSAAVAHPSHVVPPENPVNGRSHHRTVAGPTRRDSPLTRSQIFYLCVSLPNISAPAARTVSPTVSLMIAFSTPGSPCE